MKQTRAFFNRFSIGVTALWLLLFALLPNIGLLVVTVLTRGEQDFVLPQFTLDNYLRLLDPTFLKILWESLWLAFMSTLACLLVGYPFAYRIARASAKMKPWLLLLVIIPFWTNSLIRTYALILILKANGLISTLLVWLGVTEQPVSFMYGDFAVFMGILYTFLPFMVLPLYASIEKLDSRLLDAARDLGASGFQSFWHVTFPLTLPGIIAGSMLVFLPSLGAFYIPEILGGAKSMLIGNFIKNQFMVARDWPLGAAASTPSSVASEAASAATESVFTTASISAALPKSWLYHLSVNPFHADVYLAALKEDAITTKMGRNRNAYTIQSHSLPSFRIITPPRPCGRARRPCG